MARKGSIQPGKGLEHVFYKGLKYRIQSCGKYYYRNQPEHLLHRTVWIDHCGDIPKGYVIHHKDHNWRNNDISNLEMINRKLHASLHGKENVRNRQYKIIKCPSCGKDFETWRAKFCSSTCYNRSVKEKYMIEKSCSVCGVNFKLCKHLKSAHKGNFVCSLSCRGKLGVKATNLLKKKPS